MNEDGSWVIWIVLAAVPIGFILISAWSRSRKPGQHFERAHEAEVDRPTENAQPEGRRP